MRAANMQALTDDLERKYPGIVIYGIGDSAHKLVSSDHNEDDTAGSKSAQSDADNNPEHRAIDAMLNTKTFRAQEAAALVAKMVVDVPTRQRLYYIIWNRKIWSRSNNWVVEDYNGSDPHTGHVHLSGWAGDDENANSWPIVFAAPGSGPTPPRLRRPWPSYMRAGHYFGLISGPANSHGGYYSQERPDIQAIQTRLNLMGYSAGKVDGIFGPNVKAAVSRWQHARYSSVTTRFGEVWSDDWRRLFTY